MYYFNTMDDRGTSRPATRKLFHGLAGVSRYLGTDRRCVRNWSRLTELSTKRDGIRQDLRHPSGDNVVMLRVPENNRISGFLNGSLIMRSHRGHWRIYKNVATKQDNEAALRLVGLLVIVVLQVGGR